MINSSASILPRRCRAPSSARSAVLIAERPTWNLFTAQPKAATISVRPAFSTAFAPAGQRPRTKFRLLLVLDRPHRSHTRDLPGPSLPKPLAPSHPYTVYCTLSFSHVRYPGHGPEHSVELRIDQQKLWGQSPVRDLSLALSDGDHVGLIGPNGSGKSTLLKILAGLESPDQGTRTLRRHTRVGYVPQEPTFPAHQTIEQVLQDTLSEDGHDPHEQGGRIREGPQHRRLSRRRASGLHTFRRLA